MIQLRVLVSLKTSVFDPQGRTTLMPHPERASEAILGSDQGRRILEAFVSN